MQQSTIFGSNEKQFARVELDTLFGNRDIDVESILKHLTDITDFKSFKEVIFLQQ